jgi:hypothetical protein
VLGLAYEHGGNELVGQVWQNLKANKDWKQEEIDLGALATAVRQAVGSPPAEPEKLVVKFLNHLVLGETDEQSRWGLSKLKSFLLNVATVISGQPQECYGSKWFREISGRAKQLTALAERSPQTFQELSTQKLDKASPNYRRRIHQIFLEKFLPAMATSFHRERKGV